MADLPMKVDQNASPNNKSALSVAGVEGKTPHCAQHAMGVHLMKGHKNTAYSMQYARVTSEVLQEALNDR